MSLPGRITRGCGYDGGERDPGRSVNTSKHSAKKHNKNNDINDNNNNDDDDDDDDDDV